MGRITRSARLQPCTLRLPNCNGDPATTVFAHAPSASKGIGYKSPNWWGCYACSTCHDIVDGRVKHSYSQDFLAKHLLRAIHETQYRLFKDGLLEMHD